MARKAWLEGEDDTRLIHDPDRDAYHLTAPEIDNPPSGTTFYESTRNLVTRVNGFGRVADPGFHPVMSSGGFSVGDSEHHVIFAESVGELCIHVGTPAVATVTRADGTVVPDSPSPWPGRFATAGKHRDVDEVLESMGQSEPLGWFELFKITKKSKSRSGVRYRKWAGLRTLTMAISAHRLVDATSAAKMRGTPEEKIARCPNEP